MENAEYLPLAGQIATLLGDGWTVDRKWDAHGVMIDHVDGRRLHIRKPWNKNGFLTVSGEYPRLLDSGRAEYYGINVRADRGAQAFVSEITRRLMPDYQAELAKVHERNAGYQRAWDDREALMRRIRDVLGMKPTDLSGLPGWQQEQTREQENSGLSLRGSLAEGWGSVRVDYRAETVSLELHQLPSERALAILAMLRKG